ncbi:MAG TPA: CRTAC1 family protein [Acidobacteriota bacterium]|nr:CRTAC1 family protein [Acidobacteriota bacterium]
MLHVRTLFFLAALGTAAPFFAAAGSAKAVFQEGAAEAGLEFRLISGTPEKKYIVEANSAGVCLFDFDDDGLLDIFLVNGGRLEAFRKAEPSGLSHALYRNLGARRFRDVTAQAGVAGNGAWGMGCSVGDADNDGRLDLYVTAYGSNMLFRNLGDGTFRDVTQDSGSDDRRWSTGSAWADFDGDGDLDLFVANYIELDRDNLPQPGDPRYGSMGGGQLGCQYLGLKVMCGPRGLRGAGDSFFVNQGDGTFRERSRELGLHDPQGYYGLGVLWSDFDLDGDLDLYVANDSTPNQLYLNQGEGKLVETGLLSGAAFGEQGQEQAGMGVAAADYRNSGLFSLYVTNFSEEYNTLYRNDEQGNFTDITSSSGLLVPSLPYVGWGTVFFDYDNDGRVDLFVANGHVFPQIDKAQSSSSAGYAQRNLLFRNLGEGRFEEVGLEAGLTQELVSRGAAAGDLDNDGALDLVVNNLDAGPSLLWNSRASGGHYLSLKLKSRTVPSAIGARVRLRTDQGWQMQEVRSGGSYLSQNDLRLHFGLGSATLVSRLEIRWPDGKQTVLTDVAVDQRLEVHQE